MASLFHAGICSTWRISPMKLGKNRIRTKECPARQQFHCKPSETFSSVSVATVATHSSIPAARIMAITSAEVLTEIPPNMDINDKHFIIDPLQRYGEENPLTERANA